MDIYRLLNTIIFAAALVALVWLGNMYIKNQAIDGCAKNSSYSINLPTEGARVTYPVMDAYNQCLKDKGIK